jgi:hypothetical protein
MRNQNLTTHCDAEECDRIILKKNIDKYTYTSKYKEHKYCSIFCQEQERFFGAQRIKYSKHKKLLERQIYGISKN